MPTPAGRVPKPRGVVAAVADVDVYIEQPCPTYEECLSVRRRTSRPFVLDEVIGGVDSLIKGLADDAMDVINLKISKVGGLTKARLMRDICVAIRDPDDDRGYLGRRHRHRHDRASRAVHA